jgi:arginine-tRNA-protein transferase
MSSIQVGLSPPHDCPYLKGQTEQTLVLVCDSENKRQLYPELLGNGFRRSGEAIYRPHCPNCQACHSLRVDANKFVASRSQRRVLARNQDINTQWHDQLTDDQFVLYGNYLSQRHSGSPMTQPSWKDYRDFVTSPWQRTRMLELRHNDKLIGVAITDWQDNSLSAVYSFFCPTYAKRSLGRLMILKQIETARHEQLSWVYLGYQIDACKKMNYKQEFAPHQRFIAQNWMG